MTHLKHNDIVLLKTLIEEGVLDRLVLQTRQEIALTIVGTGLKDQEGRQNLYMLSQALDVVKGKAEEHVINYNNKQEAF